MQTLPDRTTSPHPPTWAPRLYRGPEDDFEPPGDTPRDDGRPSLDWTLTELYGGYVLPMVRLRPATNRRPASPKTIALDRDALVQWVRLTGDPALGYLDDARMDEFLFDLARLTGPRGAVPAANTVHRHATHLQNILVEAGPPSRKHPRALGLFDDYRRWPLGMPYLAVPPATPRRDSNWFSPADVAKLWRALDDWPDSRNGLGVAGRVIARTVASLCYNVGLRIDTVMRAEWGMIGRDCPADFIAIPAEIYKKRQQRPPFCLNRYVRQQLAEMRDAQAAAGLAGYPRLIPWGSTPRRGDRQPRPWPEGRTWFFQLFRETCQRAGIARGHAVDTNGLRAALATWAQARFPGLASVIMGHKSGNVTTDVYTHCSVLREPMSQVPQPGNLHQQELF